MSNLLDVVKAGLEKAGYDGLFNECGECGCRNGDLSPGNCFTEDCLPAYIHIHSKRPELWAMSIKQTGLTDDDIETAIEQ
jgi:hypothetical protein